MYTSARNKKWVFHCFGRWPFGLCACGCAATYNKKKYCSHTNTKQPAKKQSTGPCLLLSVQTCRLSAPAYTTQQVKLRGSPWVTIASANPWETWEEKEKNTFAHQSVAMMKFMVPSSAVSRRTNKLVPSLLAKYLSSAVESEPSFVPFSVELRDGEGSNASRRLRAGRVRNFITVYYD
jgi:hypothetical protein